MKLTTTRLTAYLHDIALAPLSARAESLSLDQCVAIALKENPDMASANYEVDAAVAKKNVARGGYSPRLKMDAGVQRWDSEFSAPLFGMFFSTTNAAPVLGR
jgi:outer membrane protein TolC